MGHILKYVLCRTRTSGVSEKLTLDAKHKRMLKHSVIKIGNI